MTTPRHYSTIGIGEVFLNDLSSDTELVGKLKVQAEDFIVKEVDADGLVADLNIPESFEREETSKDQEERTAESEESRVDGPSANPLEHCREVILSKAHDGAGKFKAIEALNLQAVNKLQNGVLQTDPVHLTFDELDKDGRGVVYKALRYAFPLLKPSPGDNKTTQIIMDVDDRFHSLIGVLEHPELDLPPLYHYFTFGYTPNQRALERNVVRADAPKLRLKDSVKREDRREIHHIIDQKSNGFLGSETLKEGDRVSISVQWTKSARRKLSGKRKRTDNYVLCVVEKTRVEHLSMINALSRYVRVRKSDIGTAGIKDRMARTTQFVTIGNIAVWQIRRAKSSLEQVGVKIKPIARVEQGLKRGYLKGNRFEITLREIGVVRKVNGTEVFSKASKTHIADAMLRLDKGFVNFFGEQRVGSPGSTEVVGVRPFDIGRAMLQKNYSLAVDLLISGRKLVNGVDMSNMDKFRITWKESGRDPAVTIKDLPSDRNSFLRERAVLQGLKRYCDPLKALKCLQFHDRQFYLNAYQSLVFNAMASERLRLYGPSVAVGDLVFRGSQTLPSVVTEKDLPMLQLQQVVLPLVGHDCLYPENKVGDFCRDFLANDNIGMKEDDPDEVRLKATYRTLIAKADDMSYQVEQKENSTNATIRFELSKGSYATMAFRELQRTTTVR